MIDFLHHRTSIIKKEESSGAYKLIRSATGGTTFAVEKIKIKNFLIGEKITLKVGFAKCSEKDNYNKKLGRELALNRMKEVKFEVTRIVYTKDEVNVDLTAEGINVELSFKQKRQLSRLDYASLE